MTRAAPALAAALLLAAPALAEPPLRFATPYASPSSVIGAEIAMSQAAQAKGRAAALRDDAADNAILFAPARVLARDWLKSHGTAAAWKRAPLTVWMSCDGSYAIARGAWQAAGTRGPFVTLWQHQPKSGAYKWLLTLEAPSAEAAADPTDMIVGKVATCRARRPAPASGGPAGVPPGGPPGQRPPGGKQKPRLLQPDIDPAAGQSDDGSLRWRATPGADGTGGFVASAWNGSTYAEVVTLTAGPAG